MIKLFVSPRSSSSRKARAWLKDHHLAFVEQNVATNHLSFTDFKQILYLTENGTEDIICTRSKAYAKLKAQLTDDRLSLKGLLALINQHPSLLRCPLIVDDAASDWLCADDIRQFIPVRSAHGVAARSVTSGGCLVPEIVECPH